MGEIITILLLNIIWLLFVLYQDRENKKERQKLLDRIMAKSLDDLKEQERITESPETPEVPPDFVPLSEADNDTFERSIKKQLGRQTPGEKIREKLKKIRKSK